MTLFARLLLAEQGSRLLSEFQQLGSFFQIPLVCLLMRTDDPLKACLLFAPFRRLAFEEGGIDHTIKFVQVHGVHSTLEGVTLGSQASDRFLPESLLLDMTLPERAGHPAEYLIIEGELIQQPGELIGEDLLAGVRLRTLPLVARAVVVDVLALLDLSHQRATTMAAGDQPRKGEFVFHFPMT